MSSSDDDQTYTSRQERTGGERQDQDPDLSENVGDQGEQQQAVEVDETQQGQASQIEGPSGVFQLPEDPTPAFNAGVLGLTSPLNVTNPEVLKYFVQESSTQSDTQLVVGEGHSDELERESEERARRRTEEDDRLRKEATDAMARLEDSAREFREKEERAKLLREAHDREYRQRSQGQTAETRDYGGVTVHQPRVTTPHPNPSQAEIAGGNRGSVIQYSVSGIPFQNPYQHYQQTFGNMTPAQYQQYMEQQQNAFLHQLQQQQPQFSDGYDQMRGHEMRSEPSSPRRSPSRAAATTLQQAPQPQGPVGPQSVRPKMQQPQPQMQRPPLLRATGAGLSMSGRPSLFSSGSRMAFNRPPGYRSVPVVVPTDGDQEFPNFVDDSFYELINFVLEGVHMDYMKGWIEAFSFSGFDPAKTMRLLKKVKKMTPNDLRKLIVLAVERGNNITKMKAKMVPKGVSELERLTTKYGIVAKAETGDHITLVRVSICFPWVTCNYMQFAHNPAVTLEHMRAICPDYPPYMMSPAFSNLIPTTSDYDLMFNGFMVHQVEFSKVVNSKNTKDKADYEIARDIRAYSAAGRNSSYISDDVRIEKLKYLGAITNDGRLSDAVLSAAEAYAQGRYQ
nr:MAG: nucleocapsid protein [Landhopper phenui-like virus 2]